ncbi:hypothetical protein BKA66DRAFT_417540 [Pyrenochaeta sp. MPI-SDFR-AT-0127]|nr:hypothetical protein BKA66DRAFT_417540 [Pyrenochaeta sp. MPI-SDFR-AT-0127]
MERKSTCSTTSPIAPPARTAPNHNSDIPTRETTDFEIDIEYEEPLYIEINIPLPRLPKPNTSSPAQSSQINSSSSLPSPSKSRGRSCTLSSLSPFRRSSSASSGSKDAEEWPRIRKDIVKSREVHAMMDLKHHNKRSRGGAIDALAVVPAVLVLSAELFTPGSVNDGREGKRKDSGVGRWEDGIR